jgi:dTDP-glucose 4,6-dehydratase
MTQKYSTERALMMKSLHLNNVLVTGGAGFIGSNFVRYLIRVSPNIRVVNLDALTYAGSLENLKDLPESERYSFIHGDICDRELVESLFRRYQIDTVVHFAAESHVDRSILGPARFIQTNIVGTFNLLEIARHMWIDEKELPLDKVIFHHISTDEVFGSLEPDAPPFNETTPYAPSSPYAASKAASDHLVRSYAHTYDLPVFITNCSNNYGPYQFPEKLIPLVILNAVEGRPLPIYGDGKQIRDWLYVDDHCEAILKVLTMGRQGETYNIGGDTQPTNLEIVQRVCAILDERLPESDYMPHESLITFVPDRPGHDRRYAMDNKKIKRDLEWSPRESLDSGLRKTVDWYLANPEWVSTIRDQSTYQEWLEANYASRGEAQ